MLPGRFVGLLDAWQRPTLDEPGLQACLQATGFPINSQLGITWWESMIPEQRVDLRWEAAPGYEWLFRSGITLTFDRFLKE